MRIELANLKNTDQIQKIYQEAIQWQKEHSYPYFESFSKEFIEKLIIDKRQYKAVKDSVIIGTFSFLDSDVELWQKDDVDAFYFHRFAVKREFKDQGFTQRAIEWAVDRAKREGKKFIRLDCWVTKKLCDYYERLGFQYVRDYKIPKKHNLPMHYDGITVKLYQIEVKSAEKG